MLLPVKDAKFKNCPLLTTKDDKLRFCLGASCMMWRYKHRSEKSNEEAEGYCGLAGRPADML